MSGIRDIDSWRKFHLALAEWIDAWRIIPRSVVVLFGYGVFGVTKWYMELQPYLLAGCVEAGGKITECLIQAPTTQHTALLTAMFALAAAVFAFYSNNGRKWNGFSHWNGKKKEEDVVVAPPPHPPGTVLEPTDTVTKRGFDSEKGNGG